MSFHLNLTSHHFFFAQRSHKSSWKRKEPWLPLRELRWWEPWMSGSGRCATPLSSLTASLLPRAGASTVPFQKDTGFHRGFWCFLGRPVHVYKARKRNRPATTLQLLTKPVSLTSLRCHRGTFSAPPFHYWAAQRLCTLERHSLARGLWTLLQSSLSSMWEMADSSLGSVLSHSGGLASLSCCLMVSLEMNQSLLKALNGNSL